MTQIDKGKLNENQKRGNGFELRNANGECMSCTEAEQAVLLAQWVAES